MRVRSKIHTREERLQQRLLADRLCHRSLLRLLCVAAILRSVITQVLPLAGSAAWWLVPVLLVPGCILVALGDRCMRKTGAETLGECARQLFGKAGVCVVSTLFAALLLIDGTCTITTLVCFFTEGMHTVGTQITMTILTCAVLLWCLDQNGLPRGIWLLRWVILGAGIVAATGLIGQAQADHLFPVLGNGTQSVFEAVKAGASLSWPLLVLLTEPPVHERSSHARELCMPLLLICVCVLLIVLALPGEIITQADTLAQSMLLPMQYLHAPVKMLMQCLVMLTMFLLIAAQARTAAKQMIFVKPDVQRFLPHGFVVALGLTQLCSIKRLWSVVRSAEAWLLLPLTLIVLGMFVVTLFRHGRAKP